jgi:hypothetical protein
LGQVVEEGERGEVVVLLDPVAQVFVLLNQVVDAVDRDLSRPVALRPHADVLLGQRGAALGVELLGDALVQPVQPAVRPHQGLARVEDVVELHLHLVGLVHDHQVGAAARHLQEAHPLRVELRGDRAVDQARGRGDPDRGAH